MTTIKITELTNIGANLASTTVFPVVNMSGTPTTEKTVLGNIANVILSGAGGNYVAVGAATVAATVTTNAQPNITSTGSLTGLTVSNAAGTVNFSNTANVTLGAVGNLHIAGGTAGQLLSTNGNGTLSWTTDANSSYGNTNVANYLPTFTGNVGAGNVIATGNLYSAGLLSNGVANINSNVVSTNPNTGALQVRGGAGVLGNIHSGGEIHSFGNIIVGGHSLFVGSGADAIGFNNATLIAFHGGNDYVQAVLKNSTDSGSADWVAYGDNGTEEQGWADFGFTSSMFDDANYTITGAGDGYFFVNTFAGSYGGNLVIATGTDGTVRDIIFATGGFGTSNEFARFDDSANYFHLTRTGSGIKFPDNTVQTTAYTGGGGANTGNVTFNNQIVLGTGSNDGGGGLYLAPGNASIANSAVQYLRVRGGDAPTHIHLDTGNNAFYDQYFGADSRYVKLEANGNVVINADDYNGNGATWTLDTTGNLELPTNGSLNLTGGGVNQANGEDLLINASDNDGIVSSSILMSPGDTLTRIEQWSGQDSQSFTTADWATGVYTTQGGQGAVTFTNAANIINFVDSLVGVGHIYFSVNGGPLLVYDGASSGGGNITFYTPTLPATDPTVVTSFSYYYSYKSGFEIDYNVQEVNIYANDADISLQTTNNRDISLDASGGVTITANSASTWQFANDGRLTFPGTPRIDTDSNNFEVQAAEAINFEANTVVNIYTDTGNNAFQWQFGDDGNLTLPDTTGVIANVSITLEANDTGNSTGLSLIGDAHANLYAHGNVTIVSDSSNTTATWSFVNTGDIVLPNDVVIGDDGSNGMMLSVPTVTPGTYFDWTFDQSGNLTLPTGGQIIVSGGLVSSGASPAPTINGFSITNSVGISGNGNIAGNNISATGNISANNFTGNGGTLSNVATKVEGSWTLASGVNTVNISVPLNGTYTIWVNGNIPNGIVTYTATAIVTNTNVPVLGEQYGWYYELGNALVLTSIPNQFVGTQGAISNASPYAGNTANVFTFGITNNSGNTAVVNYGYTKL